MRLLFFVGLALVLANCSSKKDVTVSQEEAPKFDKALNASTNQKGEKVGVRDDKVTVQKTVYLEEDLKKAQDEIEDLENRVYGQSKTYPGGIYLSLKSCRARLADPRLGGSGVPEPMEKWEKVSEKSPDYNYHVDRDNNVVAFTEEELATKISNVRKLKRMLNDNYDNFQTKLDNCQQQLDTAMVKMGLNPDDAKAQGEWVEGPNGYKVWEMRRPSTSDPEEMMKRKAEREKAKSKSE